MIRYNDETRPGCEFRYHDTAGAYNRGCRCPAACEANRIYRKRRREGRNPPTLIDPRGSQRRLQALNVLGFSIAELGDYLGIRPSTVWSHMTGRYTRITRATAARIDAVYRERCMTPVWDNAARRNALRRGWVPPLAWNDIDNDDQPAVVPIGRGRSRGSRDMLEIGEIRHLIYGGITVDDAAHRLGVTVGALEKHAYRHGDKRLIRAVLAGQRTYETRLDSA